MREEGKKQENKKESKKKKNTILPLSHQGQWRANKRVIQYCAVITYFSSLSEILWRQWTSIDFNMLWIKLVMWISDLQSVN